MGVAVLLVLFVEINALSLLIIAACVLAHTVMAYWDIAYSDKRRYISPSNNSRTLSRLPCRSSRWPCSCSCFGSDHKSIYQHSTCPLKAGPGAAGGSLRSARDASRNRYIHDLWRGTGARGVRAIVAGRKSG